MRRKHLQAKTREVCLQAGHDDYWYSLRRPLTRQQRKRERVMRPVLFMTGQSYGGPEEGGWWYDRGYPLNVGDYNLGETAWVIWKGAQKLRVIDTSRYTYKKVREATHAVGKLMQIDGSDIKIHWINGPAKSYPKYRPYYC